MSNFKFIEKNRYMREDRLYYVYIHTCPNGMCYIGMTTSPKTRWNNGKGYKDNIKFYQDILQYGWENIEHEIVAETYYGWIARKLEKDLITIYKNKNKAYNLNNEQRPAYISKRKIPLKKVGKYDKNGMLIKIYESASEAWRDGNTCEQNIQACCRGRTKTAGGYV